MDLLLLSTLSCGNEAPRSSFLTPLCHVIYSFFPIAELTTQL